MLSSRDSMLPYPPRPVIVADRRWKPNVEIAPNCPRCDSANTKFCYYNNYSLSQPRYFCKGCRRYWTKGGSLRNVPVGGGCRKNRRGKPVRLSSEPAGAAGRDHQLSHSRRPAGPLRPDLALDGMVGDWCQPNGNGPAQATDASAATADCSSTIDLAVLYAKFLNQSCPKFEPTSRQLIPVPELPGDDRVEEPAFDIDVPIGGPSCSSYPPESQMATRLPDHELVELVGCHVIRPISDHQSPAGHEPLDQLRDANPPPSVVDGEFGFSNMDPIGFGSSALPAEGVNGFFSSNYPIIQNCFESVTEDSLSLQQSLIIGDWSPSEYSTLEPFYRS